MENEFARGCPASGWFLAYATQCGTFYSQNWGVGGMLFSNYIHFKHRCMGLVGVFASLFFQMKLCGEQNFIELLNRIFLNFSGCFSTDSATQFPIHCTIRRVTTKKRWTAECPPNLCCLRTFLSLLLQWQGAGTSHAVPLRYLFCSGLWSCSVPQREFRGQSLPLPKQK